MNQCSLPAFPIPGWVTYNLCMGRTNNQVSRTDNELIAKQAAKTKEQAATARELTLELDMATREARANIATHAAYNEYV